MSHPGNDYTEQMREIMEELVSMENLKTEAREYIKRHPEAAFHIYQLMAIIETKRALK